MGSLPQPCPCRFRTDLWRSQSDNGKPLAEQIVHGHAYGDKVERVRDVADLTDESTPHSNLVVLNAKQTFAMRLVLN